MKNKYGYKVCYKLHGSEKLKVYLVTNTYSSAVWNVRWYESHSPPSKETGQALDNVIWLIVPIKTRKEYERRWRGCPF
ncbi:MAG: hypothetical protein NC548_40455 [Lachnospiraceae bacterium]|nr:hypothetical protein [Lachnospiraceae bacterium]